MKLEKQRYENILILTFTGEFDSSNLPGFSERIDKMISQGDNLMILDLHLLKFINSAALGYLIKISKSVADRGGKMVISRPSTFVQKTLSALGLESVFETFPKVEDAIQYLKRDADAGGAWREGGEHEEVHVGSVPILFRPPDAQRAPNHVGRITALYEDGLRFRYEPDGESVPDLVDAMLETGQSLQLKFRVPLAAWDRYFEPRAEIEAVRMSRPADDRGFVWAVRVRFDDMGSDDRELLRPFTFGDDTPGAGGIFARMKPRPSGGTGHASPEHDRDERT